MPRYINLDELLTSIDKRNGRLPLWLDEILMEDCKIADVQPVKHGKWISMLVKRPDWKGNMQSYYQPNTCSECHIGLAEKTNYCPNCGAIMDGDPE